MLVVLMLLYLSSAALLELSSPPDTALLGVSRYCLPTTLLLIYYFTTALLGLSQIKMSPLCILSRNWG
jgi:hypothetical protein